MLQKSNQLEIIVVSGEIPSKSESVMKVLGNCFVPGSEYGGESGYGVKVFGNFPQAFSYCRENEPRIAAVLLYKPETASVTAAYGPQDTRRCFSSLRVNTFIPMVKRKEGGKAVPIMVATSGQQDSVVRTYLDCGADLVISPPYEVHEIAARIFQLIKTPVSPQPTSPQAQ